MTGPKGLFETLRALVRGQLQRQAGYAIAVTEALAILDKERPAAAAWWRQNAPHLCKPGKAFVFSDFCCQVEPDDGAA